LLEGAKVALTSLTVVHSERVEGWLEKAMEDGMNEALNSPEVAGPCVLVEVEANSGMTW
jgi:hypothetical protein